MSTDHPMLRMLLGVSLYIFVHMMLTDLYQTGCRRATAPSSMETLLQGFVTSSSLSQQQSGAYQDPSILQLVMEEDLMEANARPLFLIYVGLPETGDHDWQCTLCRNASADVIERDDWVFLGTCPEECRASLALEQHDLSFFEKRPVYDSAFGPILHNASMAAIDNPKHDGLPRLAPEFMAAVEAARQQEQSVLVVDGRLHALTAKHIRALAAFLNPNFYVHILVGYQPLYRWLPHHYGEVMRPAHYRPAQWWPGHVEGKLTGVRLEPWSLHGNASDFDQLVQRIQNRQQHPAAMVRDNYRRQFAHVHVLGLHRLSSSSSSLTHLFCHVLGGLTPATCRALQGGQLPLQQHSNVPYPFALDALATEAYQQGLVKVNVAHRPTKFTVMERLGEANIDMDKLPVVCWNQSDLDELEQLSLALEQELFPGASSFRHGQGFQAAVAAGTYCRLDAAAAVEQWRNVFTQL